MSGLARLRTDPYAQAAAAYLAYGIAYMAGAVARLAPERQVTAFGFVPWQAWFVGGAVVMVLGPLLLWRRTRWFARILFLGPAGKALWLAWSLGRGTSGDGMGGDGSRGPASQAFDWTFAVLAILAAIAIFRAGWGTWATATTTATTVATTASGRPNFLDPLEPS